MKFGVVCKQEDPRVIEDVKKIIKILMKRKHRPVLEKGLKDSIGSDFTESAIDKMRVGMILVVGDDSTILRAVREMGSKEISVLGVSSGSSGFLTETDIVNFEKSITKIENNDYYKDKRARLSVMIDKVQMPHAVNDVVISSSHGATLIRYTLKVNDEIVWRDSADGIIISTPTGSTGYSLSSGGPIVSTASKVFVISPVCSIENKKPYVIDDNNKIIIADVFCPEGSELVIDGRHRTKLGKNKIIISKSKSQAIFVRFDPRFHSRVFHKLWRKIEDVENMPKNAPPSAKFVVKLLQYEGPLTQKEIISLSMLPPRTVRSALNFLEKNNLISQKTSLRDVRQNIYFVNL
jgi:NAD+ kinase